MPRGVGTSSVIRVLVVTLSDKIVSDVDNNGECNCVILFRLEYCDVDVVVGWDVLELVLEDEYVMGVYL